MLSKLLMKRNCFFIVILVVFALTSCRKPEQFPIEPVITFKDMYTKLNSQGYDQNIEVVLNFTDGDGDIGYKESGNGAIFDDPNSQYYENFVVKIYELKNGMWYSGHPWDTIDIGARIPYITPVVSNKALEGEILRELPVPPHLTNDTFRFDIFIYDRGLHKSNIITTPAIILNTQ